MTANIFREKFGRRFETLDVDNNGVIERTDYEAYVERIAAAAGRDPDSSVIQRLREMYLALWDDIARRATSTRLTREQYIQALHDSIVTNEAGADELFYPLVSTLIDIFDTNEDGHLDNEEFARWMVAYGVTRNRPRKHSANSTSATTANLLARNSPRRFTSSTAATTPMREATGCSDRCHRTRRSTPSSKEKTGAGNRSTHIPQFLPRSRRALRGSALRARSRGRRRHGLVKPLAGTGEHALGLGAQLPRIRPHRLRRRGHRVLRGEPVGLLLVKHSPERVRRRA